MNICCHVGRVTRDCTANYTQGNNPMCIARFTLAVDRRFKKAGQQNADFISFVAFGKTGEFCEKYAKKGVKFAIHSHVQTGSYQKDGQTVYTTDFVVDNIEFAESKASQAQNTENAEQQTAPAQNNSQQGLDGFMSIPDSITESMPFM